MAAATAMTALVVWLAGAAPAVRDAAIEAAAPRCPEAAEYCVGVRLFLAADDGGEVPQTPAWIATQLAEANRHFAPIGVGFELEAALRIGARHRQVDTRAQRDRLGRARARRGVIDVYLVARLADVDIEGAEIRGVHWRDRRDRARRWIILSAIAPRHVLAHELGHYFGLPHSKRRGSLMNKSREDPTPWSERTFVAAERRRAKARAARYLRDGTLVARER